MLRNGATLSPIVAHPAKLDTGWKLGFHAVPVPIRTRPAAASARRWPNPASSAPTTRLLIVEVLERIFTHKVSVTQLPAGGHRPHGRRAAEMKGWLPKFGLAGEISLNLGILNLLPFPILDGGMIILLLIESVIRHDISITSRSASTRRPLWC